MNQRYATQKHVTLGPTTHISHKSRRREAVEGCLASSLTQPYNHTDTTLYKGYQRGTGDPRENKTEITEYLIQHKGAVREEEIKKWKEQSKLAEEEVRKIGNNLKESRESKLFQKRKRTDRQPNQIFNASKQVLLPTPKQPHVQANPPMTLSKPLQHS